MSVADAVYKAIQDRQIDHAFCVPGESYLAVMNAFHGSNRPVLVSARHEEGAGLMAEAYAKATGRTGVCMVTRGPGLTHLSIALHTAHQDSTPLVALVGQVPTSVRYREAFQEMDIVAYARPMAKYALEIGRADRAAELIDKAFHVAGSGRPGPVVVSLPEDVDRSKETSEAARSADLFAPGMSAAAARAAADLISKAKRPCIVAGGGVTRSSSSGELVRLAETLEAGVFTAWRRFDAFPNDHRLYLGGLPVLPADLVEPLRTADLIIAIGTRLGEFTTLAYSWPSADQQLLHIDISAEDTGAGWAGADLAIVAETGEALATLNRELAGRPETAEAAAARKTAVSAQRKLYETRTTPRAGRSGSDGAVDPEGVQYDLNRLMPPESSVSSDAGTFGGWLMRYYRWRQPRTFFGPTAGGMGYALPAAIGAKLARPEAPAVAFAGDGGFAMTMSEIETAVRMGLSGLVALVYNNGTYGTIRRHQQRNFPGRIVATDLGTIDFAMAAKAMGAAGFTVRRNADFADAFKSALAADVPAVIDIRMDPDCLDAWDDG